MVLLIASLAPVLVILGFFIVVGRNARKKGTGCMSTMVLGATHNLLNEGKRQAAVVIVQNKVGTRLEEQSSEGNEDR